MWEQFLHYLSADNGLFLAIGYVGMIAHAIKKYYANELKGSIWDYIFRNNPRRTFLAVFTNFGALATIILSNQIPNQFGAFILLAFTTGFTTDSTVNRDNTPPGKDD